MLDVAIGTGLIAQAARQITGARSQIIGLDLSEAMLEAARRKLDIPLIQGMAEKLPLADESVDFVVMGYAIRHIADLDTCFQEFRRVLRHGGTLLLLEVSSPGRAIFKSTLAQYLGRDCATSQPLGYREGRSCAASWTIIGRRWKTVFRRR